MYIGDKENSNSDSALVSTKRSLIYNQLNKELYQKFFMTTEELQACRDGYIYIHDMSARRDTMNCCLFNVKDVLTGGFEMGNLWYNEPKTLEVAFDVIGDIVLSAASQQYGGFTVPSVDLLLEPFAEKSYEKYYRRYIDMGLTARIADREAMKDIQKDFDQGFQGWEYKFNTVASSRGDYPLHHNDLRHRHRQICENRIHHYAECPQKRAGQKELQKACSFPEAGVPL